MRDILIAAAVCAPVLFIAFLLLPRFPTLDEVNKPYLKLYLKGKANE